MPELAEIKIMSDHINNKCSGLLFSSVLKNPDHKSKTNLDPLSEFMKEEVSVSSEARGKELSIIFSNKESEMKLYFMMGMSGNFKAIKDDRETPKHTHLRFFSNSVTLCMYDLRRFARWKIDSKWNEKRGPCPVTEFYEFKKNIEASINKRPFDKPIFEALMDQEYFNGIGNYLRAEILGRIDYDPRVSAREYINRSPHILDLCKEIPKQAYVLGGGRLKDWYNNEELQNSPSDFREWMKFYSNRERCEIIKDSTGRTFWIDKKWN